MEKLRHRILFPLSRIIARFVALSLICLSKHLTDAARGNINSLTQPQIYVEDGHVYFIPAENKNLVLVSKGEGKILLNNVELQSLLDSVQNSSRDVRNFKNVFGTPTSASEELSTRLISMEQTVERLNQIETIETRLSNIERLISVFNTTGRDGGSRLNNRIRRLRTRIETIEGQINGIGTSNQSPCSSNPCSNGAKCIPTIYGAYCMCGSGWEGERCDQDIDECFNNAGTEFACKNGATCINTPGSYRCQCRSGWFGVDCDKRSGDCSSASSFELCGYGICVNQHSGSNPYTCLCDPGWTKGSGSPACTLDVDECSIYHASCSVTPPVQCINTQGSFVCGPCPPGYSGNGHHCTDINECIFNNGGCSVNPMVQCTNTVGSRNCGSCPPGYLGDGVTCQYVGICNINNGGCFPQARCVSNPMIGQSFVQCICPAGYTGSGYGLNGCTPLQISSGGSQVAPVLVPTGSPCIPNPCSNGGICNSYQNSFTCSCTPGFTGITCSNTANACISQPCQNGGTCVTTPLGFTCMCPDSFAGHLCDRQTESCGGQHLEESGIIRFPQTQLRYNHNANCEWLMYTTQGKVFNLTFTQFHMEGATPCTFDYLEIRDGADSRSPTIGRFCGQQLPLGGNIVSTHNALHLSFRSDNSIDGLGFEFHWNSTVPICGGVIEDKSYGSISSPGYPGNYPHNRDCTWKIKVSLGKRVSLVFATFQLETHPNCSYDYLEIRDGFEDTAPLLEKLCNTTAPAPVTSSGAYLTLRFHSDDSSSDQGFFATFTETPGVPGCGGLLTTATGVFSSPHHPQPYAHGLECDWLIRLPSRDDRINLKFLTFDLERGYNSCYYDFVEIRDGPSPTSPLVGRFCGNTLPLIPSYKSTSNQLFVKFKSDESIAAGGFSAKFEAVCGGELSTPTGVLRSPYYPSNYPKFGDCVYVINQPAGKGILLQFLDFDIEPGTDISCIFDFLEIRDGDTENSTLIGHYCGPPQASPGLVTSSYNYLWLRFKTDGSVQNKGFLANYTTFDTGCGGILRDSTGTIASPGHPEVYPHGVSCMWVIRGNPGQIVRLTWDTFNLESSSNCRYDVVEIYDNSTMFINGSLAGRYCGQDLPPTKTSSDTTLTVMFKSDHSQAYDGFMATYRILNATTACGGNFFTPYGVVKSPRYPDTYPNSKTCTWVITAPRGRQIELNVTDFDVENASSSGCKFDYLEIRNGHLPTSPLIGKFCGDRPPPSRIPSFSNSLYLKFSSDVSHTRKGFHIIWDATSTGCGGILNSPSGSITSPNYPMAYDIAVECVWKIYVNKGSAVQLTFVDIDIQQSHQCWRKYVEILDGTERNSPSLGKYCSEEHAISLQSTENSVTVKTSPYGSNGKGFRLNYRTMCNRVIKGFQGVIESPNFPNPYAHNRNCTWTIQASRGNKVNMSFSHFDIEAPHRGNCSFDFVQIKEWKRHNDFNKTIIGTYCGTDRPTLVSSSADTVSVTFVSDYSYANNGFRLEWKQYGCGGRIIGDYSIINTPDYPRLYAHSMECIWKVTTELGTKVKLTIYRLDIEVHHDCLWDGLEVHGGPDETSPLLNRLCTAVSSPTIVETHGNNMYLRFYSDGSVASQGFYGTVQQTYGGCGGMYLATSGYIYSPNYPQNYDHGDDCFWQIDADWNHVVELKFEDFDVERHSNCSYDHVAVYDGSSESDPLLLMHCGNQLPDPVTIRSTGSRMLVHLKTDVSSSGKGFKAKYTQGCGARLTGRQSGTITTPNYPSRISGFLNCSWIIMGSDLSDRVTFTFTHMDLGMQNGDGACSSEYVEVLDGDDSQAPPLYKGCDGSIPPSLTSHGNALFIQIVGGIHYRGHGFRAVYDMSSSACGGILTAASGSITSPNYPNGYPPNAECIWVIKASPGNQVQISFRQFELEASDYCNSDFVEIHEGTASGELLGHFCGRDVPTNITAKEKLWILLRTDGEGQAAGFRADFNLVHGVELSGSTGLVASPMYPQPFSGTGTFTWRIFVNESFAIQISFLNFEFDVYFADCTQSSLLTIYDGYDENSPVLMSECSRNVPEPLTSSGNVVYIKYVRMEWTNLFLLKWQQVQSSAGLQTYVTNISGCGGNYSVGHNNATFITSPGFPSYYVPHLNCEWTLDALPNSKLKVTVSTMALESHHSCLYDKVELYDGVAGLPNYVLNKTLCGVNEQNTSYLTSGRYLRVAFKTDDSVERQGFNLTISTECGGYIRDSRGTIASPNYPNNYVASNCIWHVIVRPGRTIRINFSPTFDVYSSGECATDQLILRNGADGESPLLGRFCGNTAPQNFETSGNQLFVHFKSLTHAGKGFAFTFEEVSLGCGGTIHLADNAPSSTIQSPNFPQAPVPYTECEWIFTAPQGEAIQITFLMSFQLSNSPGCQQAGVEVRDGGTAIASELGIFCRTMPGTLKSTGNVMYIKYYTNVLEPGTGFKAEVKIATCGGIHTGRYGTISSPGFPTTYEVSLDCQWTIKAPSGQFIILEFQNFNLGLGDVNCTKDKVYITEQTSLDVLNPRNWTFCGDSDNQLPNRIQTGNNEIQIRFTSDSQRETLSGMGFKLRYRTQQQYCSQLIREASTGIITSPQFPQPYPHNSYCVWKIYAPPGRRIRFEFTDFNLPEPVALPYGHMCLSDQLWIYQGVYRDMSPLYTDSICGSTLPDPVETTSSEATIYFRSDTAIAHSGFKLTYSTHLPILCGGILEYSSGNITSPNTTTNTPTTTNNILCEWKTEVQREYGNGTTIVTIHGLQIPSSRVKDPICSQGFLKVSPANTFIQYKWRKLCGTLTNEKIYLPGGSLFIEYISNDKNASFNLSYRNIPCGGTLYDTDQNITSINYPSPYGVNTECIWTLSIYRGSQIKVKFYDIDLDEHQGTDGCDKDFVTIRNGKYPSSPVLGKYCGSSLPADITSMSNELWIEFHSDENSNGGRHGFNIGFESISGGCGGVLHTKNGQLSSPVLDGDSRRYPHNTECEWIVESVPGYTVNIVFFDRFDIAASSNCSDDFVEVFKQSSDLFGWTSLGKYCGRQLPKSINTTSTSVKIKFKSNENLNGDGFRLYWYSPCGGVFNNSNGVIRSAHYDAYNHSQHQHVNPGSFWSVMGWESVYRLYTCDYVIQGNPEDYIFIQFVDPFEIQVPWMFPVSDSELNVQCPRVNVTVSEGNDTNTRRRTEMYCGLNIPPPFIARGSSIVSYSYEPIYQNFGFRIHYSKYDCGGEVTMERILRSPGNPVTSASNMNCTWIVKAPQNRVVRFKFKFLELEFHYNCGWDAMRLYDGPLVDDNKLIGTYCGNLTRDIPIISSKLNSMTVVFLTDSVVEHGGFEAAVDFTVGESQGCGGRVNVTNGPVTLQSIDMDKDGKYDDDLDCAWLVFAAEYNSIEITFSSFNLEGSEGVSKSPSDGANSISSCPFDFVEVRDGPGPNGQLLYKLCGSTAPARIQSSQHIIWVRFYTDGSINFPGFNLTVKSKPSPCGPVVLNATSTVQYLTSPLFPLNYDINVRCRWTINGARSHDEVDITFIEMDIEPVADCQKDRLEIRDLSYSYTTPEGISGPTLFVGSQRPNWRFRNLNLSMDSILQNVNYCGSQTPPDFFSIGRSVELLFVSDETTTRKGFKIAYKKAGCNKTYEQSQGRIFSPEWPTHTPIFSNCLSSIRTPNGTFISLYFNTFMLPSSGDQNTCSEAGLEVRDGTPAGTILARYCGTSIPDPVFSLTNTLYIKFFSRLHPLKGFDITYTSSDMGRGCGGEIFHTGGSFTSPMYPGNYSSDADCKWKIRVPGSLRIQIEFTNFMFGGNCMSDFLEISTMNSHEPDSAPLLFTKYCADDVPAVFMGATDTALVRYKTSVNNTGSGWRAIFKGLMPSDVPNVSI